MAIASSAMAQNTVRLNISVKSTQNSPLPFASLKVDAYEKAYSSDSLGNISISLPKGTTTIEVYHLCCKKYTSRLFLGKDTILNIILKDFSIETQEIEITERKLILFENEPSETRLQIQNLKLLPTNMGEPDILKQMAFQSGVTTIGDGSSAYFVRGSQSNANRILLDGAPVYDPGHMLGLFSVFNSDALFSATFHKTYIPASLSGRTASVLDIHAARGDSLRWHGNISAGLIASRFHLNGPIIKNKLLISMSFRRSYADAIVNTAHDIYNRIPKNDGLYFWDANAKVSYIINKYNTIEYTFYQGKDVIIQKPNINVGWGNQNHVITWGLTPNSRFALNTKVYYSSFGFKLDIEGENQNLRWTNDVKTFGTISKASYKIGNKLSIETGVDAAFHHINPALFEPINNNSLFRKTDVENYSLSETRFFTDFTVKPTTKTEIKLGLNYALFARIGRYNDVQYLNPSEPDFPIRSQTNTIKPNSIGHVAHSLEPRVMLVQNLNPNLKLYAAYQRTSQGMHQIVTGVTPLPVSFWIASSRYVPIILSDQFSIGTQYKNPFWGSFSAEMFYKHQNNTPDFVDNAKIFLNQDYITSIRWGKTNSYGLELGYRRSFGKFQPLLSYTLSKSEMQTPGVNLDKPYASPYDRRHIFSAVVVYQLSKKLSISSTFIYSTGRPVTLPTGIYQYQHYQLGVITERNSYRLPDYHRLDIAINYYPKTKRKLKSEWNFTIYNVYARKNAFTVAMQPVIDERGAGSTLVSYQPVLIYLFTILPSVSYTLRLP